MISRRHLWLCLPPTILAVLDYTLTLAGQHPQYWEGDYALALEGNPIAWIFLAWHPAAFLVLCLGWLVAFSAAILLLPPASARVVSFVITFSHCIGAATWLWREGTIGLVFILVVFLVAERLVQLSWRKTRA